MQNNFEVIKKSYPNHHLSGHHRNLVNEIKNHRSRNIDLICYYIKLEKRPNWVKRGQIPYACNVELHTTPVSDKAALLNRMYICIYFWFWTFTKGDYFSFNNACSLRRSDSTTASPDCHKVLFPLALGHLSGIQNLAPPRPIFLSCLPPSGAFWNKNIWGKWDEITLLAAGIWQRSAYIDHKCRLPLPSWPNYPGPIKYPGVFSRLYRLAFQKTRDIDPCV